MKTKITFKEWLANLGKGIWQALCWIGRAFNPKYKSIFGRICWGAITVCIIVLTCLVIFVWFREAHKSETRYASRSRISSSLTFRKPSYSTSSGWIQNHHTGEIVEKNIDWISLPTDEDSLMVFSRKGKRGYINRFSGRIAIQPKFQHAWIFSEGIAAVAEKDNVYFIDHSGKAINGRKFRYNAKNQGYVFHGGHCPVAIENGKMGLVDRNGEWAVKPEYDWIVAECHNFWRMRKGNKENGLWYAFNDKAEQVTFTGYRDMKISDDLGIVVTLPNHLQEAYGFDGIKADHFLVEQIEEMFYNLPSWDANGNRDVALAPLILYRMPDGHAGLCTRSGEIITEPRYSTISPIDSDTYLCSFKDSDVSEILNSKGEAINKNH